MSAPLVCEWDGRTDNVRLTGSGEWLCAGCRATIARLIVLNAVAD